MTPGTRVALAILGAIAGWVLGSVALGMLAVVAGAGRDAELGLATIGAIVGIVAGAVVVWRRTAPKPAGGGRS